MKMCFYFITMAQEIGTNKVIRKVFTFFLENYAAIEFIYYYLLNPSATLCLGGQNLPCKVERSPIILIVLRTTS